MAIPAPIARLAGLLGGISLAAGAITIMDAVAGIQFDPPPPSDYSTNVPTQFPSDLPAIDGQLYCMMFQFYKYNRPSILVSPNLVPYGAIVLPIPSDLVDQSKQSYSEETSNLAAGVAMETIATGGPQAGVSNILTTAAQSFAAGGLGSIQNIASAVGGEKALNKALAFAGVAQNPFLSVLFNAPNFKRHAFSWTLIPENEKDVENLNYILNKFRYHSMPDINSSTGGILLDYPDMCIPTIIPSGYMYDFKQCVIESISINYAPGDTPAFNVKQAPNAIKLTVQLLEIEYWVKSDLDNRSSDFNNNNPSSGLFGQTPYGSGR